MNLGWIIAITGFVLVVVALLITVRSDCEVRDRDVAATLVFGMVGMLLAFGGIMIAQRIDRSNRGCFRYYPEQYTIDGRVYHTDDYVIICPADDD